MITFYFGKIWNPRGKQLYINKTRLMIHRWLLTQNNCLCLNSKYNYFIGIPTDWLRNNFVMFYFPVCAQKCYKLPIYTNIFLWYIPCVLFQRTLFLCYKEGKQSLEMKYALDRSQSKLKFVIRWLSFLFNSVFRIVSQSIDGVMKPKTRFL